MLGTLVPSFSFAVSATQISFHQQPQEKSQVRSVVRKYQEFDPWEELEPEAAIQEDRRKKTLTVLRNTLENGLLCIFPTPLPQPCDIIQQMQAPFVLPDWHHPSSHCGWGKAPNPSLLVSCVTTSSSDLPLDTGEVRDKMVTLFGVVPIVEQLQFCHGDVEEDDVLECIRLLSENGVRLMPVY